MHGKTNIQLTHEPLDVAAAAAWVASPEAGGIDIFLGTTRAEMQSAGDNGGRLVALDYHAYEEMAVKEIEKLVQQSRDRWPVHRVAVWHRLGEVRVGQASIIIAVSCPHRAEAFDACRFIIDELKKTVPIWKREVFQNAAQWQSAGPHASEKKGP